MPIASSIKELLSLENQVAMVTGAASGIGRGMARRLAEAGATWRENLTNNVPVGQQQEAVLKMAELAAAQTYVIRF